MLARRGCVLALFLGFDRQPEGVQHVHSSLKATADTYGAQVLGIRPDDLMFSWRSCSSPMGSAIR